jgi:hypothetical protein
MGCLLGLRVIKLKKAVYTIRLEGIEPWMVRR